MKACSTSCLSYHERRARCFSHWNPCQRSHLCIISSQSHHLSAKYSQVTRHLTPHGRRGAATSVPQHPARGATAPPSAAGGGRQRGCSRHFENKQWRHHCRRRQPLGEPAYAHVQITVGEAQRTHLSSCWHSTVYWAQSFLFGCLPSCFSFCIVLLSLCKTSGLLPCCVPGACGTGLSREGVAALPAAADGTGAPHNAGRMAWDCKATTKCQESSEQGVVSDRGGWTPVQDNVSTTGAAWKRAVRIWLPLG